MDARAARRGERWLRALVLVLAVGAAGPARAQIVNVNPLFVAEDHEGFSAQAEGSADWRTGNTRFLLLSANASARFRHQENLVLAFTRWELGFQGPMQFVSRNFEHLRYRRRLLEWLQGEVFVQHDRDEFRRLSVRMLAGSGPRFELVLKDTWELALGVAYLLEYEKLREGMFPDSGAEVLGHRLSTYLVSTVRLSELLRLGVTVYLQPRFTDVRDLRALAELDLQVAVTKRFAVKLTFSAAYDSRPPAGLVPLDTVLKASFQVGF